MIDGVEHLSIKQITDLKNKITNENIKNKRR